MKMKEEKKKVSKKVPTTKKAKSNIDPKAMKEIIANLKEIDKTGKGLILTTLVDDKGTKFGIKNRGVMLNVSKMLVVEVICGSVFDGDWGEFISAVMQTATLK